MQYTLFKAALNRLVQAPPYGVQPYQADEHRAARLRVRGELNITEDDWRAYRWNPPQSSSRLNPDNAADAKPTWMQLVTAAAEKLQEEAVKRLRADCASRITRGYGELTPQDENHQRLKAMEPGADDDLQRRITAGHAERDRLLARYHEIKTWLLTLTDLDRLKNLTFETDDYWTTTWSPPA